eukprot:2274174-Prymnesium_polylepis.1
MAGMCSVPALFARTMLVRILSETRKRGSTMQKPSVTSSCASHRLLTTPGESVSAGGRLASSSPLPYSRRAEWTSARKRGRASASLGSSAYSPHCMPSLEVAAFLRSMSRRSLEAQQGKAVLDPRTSKSLRKRRIAGLIDRPLKSRRDRHDQQQ